MLRAPSQKGFIFEWFFCRFLPEIMGTNQFLDGHELVPARKLAFSGKERVDRSPGSFEGDAGRSIFRDGWPERVEWERARL